MRRRHLDDDAVSKLRALGKRYNQPDTELPGHYIRVSPTGVKSYWVAARGPGQKNYTWKPIGSPPTMGLAEARSRAKKLLASIRASGAANSFEVVSAKWRQLHVEARKLRSMDEIDRHLKRMSLEVVRSFGHISKVAAEEYGGHWQEHQSRHPM